MSSTVGDVAHLGLRLHGSLIGLCSNALKMLDFVSHLTHICMMVVLMDQAGQGEIYPIENCITITTTR